MAKEGYRFKKVERLTSKKRIAEIFSKGKSGFSYPIKIQYTVKSADQGTAHVLISVPKRFFKKAVDRNHLKRLIREAYRQNKASLLEFAKEKSMRVDIAFIYVGKKVEPLAQVEKGVLKGIREIERTIGKSFP
jgi:ribonuclease P protein component